MHSENRAALLSATLFGFVVVGWGLVTGRLDGILGGLAILIGGWIVLRLTK